MTALRGARETDAHQHHGAERLPATRARLVQCQTGLSYHPRMRVDRPRETVYGITSLPRDQAHAARLLELNRHHWAIENSVLYVRDETLGEDRSRSRTTDHGRPQQRRPPQRRPQLAPHERQHEYLRQLARLLVEYSTRKESLGHCVTGGCRGHSLRKELVRNNYPPFILVPSPRRGGLGRGASGKST